MSLPPEYLFDKYKRKYTCINIVVMILWHLRIEEKIVIIVIIVLSVMDDKLLLQISAIIYTFTSGITELPLMFDVKFS